MSSEKINDNLELKTDKVIDKLGNYSSKLPVLII